jgi:hypothetical protein
MAVAARASGTGTGSYSASASPVVTKPAGIVDGDLIFIEFSGDTTFTMTVPSGWTNVANVNNGTDNTTQVIAKIASSEPSSWTFTGLFTSAQTGAWGVSAYSGADPTIATALHKIASGTVTTANPKSMPAVVPTVNDCMIVGFSGCDQPNSSFNATAGATPVVSTERLDFAFNANGWVYCEDFLQTTAASVSQQFTTSAAVTACVIQVAVAPAAAGSTPVSGSDSATVTDAGAASVTASGSQTGAGTDAATVSATLSSSDSGSSTESGTVQATTPVAGSDSGTGTDATGAVSVSASVSDAGTGTDSGVITDASAGGDTGAGSDAGSVTVSATLGESGSVSEAGSASVTASGSDSGTATDAGTVTDLSATQVSGSDSASSFEAGTVVDVTPPPVEEEGGGDESSIYGVPARRLFDGDTGHASESGTVVKTAPPKPERPLRFILPGRRQRSPVAGMDVGAAAETSAVDVGPLGGAESARAVEGSELLDLTPEDPEEITMVMALLFD